jgi:hypothetical protein
MRLAPRRKFNLSRSFIFLLAFITLAWPAFRSSGGGLPWFAHAAAKPEAVRPQRRQRERGQPCPTCAPPSSRRIYAPAIELREAERCEIVLNNRSPNALELTPTFYTASGQTVVGTPVQLQPAEIRFMPIEQLMPETLRGQHKWGGIGLSYTGGVLEVWAQTTFHGVGGGSIDETFNILEEPGSDTREAVWWMPKGSEAVIALGNSSDTAIHTTAQFSIGDAEEIDIPPFATKFIRRHAQDREAESVQLTNAGPDGSLRVAGFITGEEQKFTSSIRFYDTKRTVQSNLYATNLRLDNTNARMVLKNTSDALLSVRPRFLSSAGEQGNPVELPSVTLQPQQIVDVDLSALREAVAARSDLASVSVQIFNNGAPGSLIGSLYSTDGTTQLTYDVPLRDSGKMRNATGSYPWRVDDDYSTVVVITNIGNQPARFQVEIRYAGGPYSVKQRELAVGETATFDLRQMRDEQKPDRVGKTLPRNLDRGQFHWSLVATPGEAHIIGRAEVISRSARVSSSYSCPVCCPDSGPSGGFDPNAYGLYVDNFAFTNARGDYYDCYGNFYAGTLAWNSMWTNNTSIAAINASTEELHGMGAGETEVEGNYQYVDWFSDGMDCYQSYGSGSDSAPVEVDCSVPTDETTAFSRWADVEGVPTVGMWTQTVLPASINFSGRTVTEEDPGGGGPDTCWFPGSVYAPFTAITGGDWTVTSSNTWQFDAVGPIPAAVTYYRAHNRTPCSVTIPQRMVINCSSGALSYKTNWLGYVIGDTTVSSIREGTVVNRTWP